MFWTYLQCGYQYMLMLSGLSDEERTNTVLPWQEVKIREGWQGEEMTTLQNKHPWNKVNSSNFTTNTPETIFLFLFKGPNRQSFILIVCTLLLLFFLTFWVILYFVQKKQSDYSFVTNMWVATQLWLLCLPHYCCVAQWLLSNLVSSDSGLDFHTSRRHYHTVIHFYAVKIGYTSHAAHIGWES